MRPEISEARVPRFTVRLSFFEQPEVVERLARAAANEGLSVSAATRSAIRYWLGAWQPDDEDDD